ncbi:MAG: class I SAM-dependent methyltransferase [Acidimicrobiales bacterium]
MVRPGGPGLQDERERREIGFWGSSETEAPGVESLDVLTNKMSEARVLLEKLDRFAPLFEAASVVVDLGAGQCWSSSMLKSRFGADTVVIGTDIAADAVASASRWEDVFKVRLDGRLACRSYATPFADASVDLVVAFAAAHHFGAHRRTLAEIHRVLRPGGTALYLHEPACRDLLYRAARWRVNRKRPEVVEDVLRIRHLAGLATAAGLGCDIRPAPTTTYRGAFETVYYLALQKLPLLRRVLPCSVDVVLTKGP